MNIYENRFDINKFIEQCKEKDWIDIIDFAQKEYERSSSKLKNVDSYINDRRIKYYDFVHMFLFYMRNGMKPGGVNDEDFKNMEDIRDKLIEKGQWTKDE